jgi:hypothetical protein
MSRTTATARTSRRGVLVVVVAALVLAGCGSAKVVVGPHLTGSPSLSIDVPLQSVACTTSGACVAAGANGSTVAPSAVVQVSRANGVWTAPSIPSTVVTSISSSACWASQCLVGGTQLSGDALWLVSPATMTVTASMTPSAGKGVSALSCFAAASCAVVDTTGITGSARLSFTSDAGGTWTTPESMPWTTGESVTALSCADAMNCLVASTNSNRQALLEVTHDGGMTWAVRTVPTTWISINSLTCVALRCVGLVTTAAQSLVERTSTFARLWTSVALNDQANALACARLTRCAVVGQTANQAPWLATLHGKHVTNVALKYVPSPLLDVACGVKVCSAIAASTVLSLRP